MWWPCFDPHHHMVLSAFTGAVLNGGLGYLSPAGPEKLHSQKHQPNWSGIAWSGLQAFWALPRSTKTPLWKDACSMHGANPSQQRSLLYPESHDCLGILSPPLELTPLFSSVPQVLAGQLLSSTPCVLWFMSSDLGLGCWKHGARWWLTWVSIACKPHLPKFYPCLPLCSPIFRTLQHYLAQDFSFWDFYSNNLSLKISVPPGPVSHWLIHALALLGFVKQGCWELRAVKHHIWGISSGDRIAGRDLLLVSVSASQSLMKEPGKGRKVQVFNPWGMDSRNVQKSTFRSK